jgi:peptide/nickel transport system substrate-binding protein
MNLWLAYIFALIKRKKNFLFAVLFLFVFIIGAGFFLSKELFKRTLTEGFIGTYQEKDLPETVTHLLSKSLVSLDKSGLPQKELAEGWEVNENATEYIFTLKPQMKWSDGVDVKSSDIDFSIPDVEITYPETNKIKFKIADSFSPFPTLLTKPIFRKGTLIGVGPYTINQIKKDGLFIKRLSLSSSDPNLPQLIIKFYPSEKIAKTAMKLGEVESLFGITELSNQNENPQLKVWTMTNYEQLVTIFYNAKDPVLSDENFRLALSYMAPGISGEEQAVTSLPPSSWAFNKDVKDYLDNDEAGKISLQKVKSGKDSTITLTVTTSLKAVGNQVVEAWKRNGVNAVVSEESGVPQNFQALLITQNIPADPDQYALWHSTQLGGSNISQYSSPRIDKNLEDGRKLTDFETRKAKYQDFQKTLLDHSPATFLYFPKYNIEYKKKSESKLMELLKLQFPHKN